MYNLKEKIKNITVPSIRSYNTKHKQLVKTQIPYLQEPWGGAILPGSCIVIGGHSSAGKSYEVETLIDELIDEKINPKGKDYCFLMYSLEMSALSLLLRHLSKVTGISKKDILLGDWTEEQFNEKFDKYIDEWALSSKTVVDEPTSPEKFIQNTEKFLKDNINKEACVVVVDHMALLGEGQEITSAVSKVLAAINSFKLIYPNSYYILLTQFSPTYFTRIEDKSNRARPNERDTYYSGSLSMTADYTVMIINAHQLGIEAFLSVNPDRYRHLEKYFKDEKLPKGKVTFKTEGLLFYFLVKNREAERGYKDLFIKELYQVEEEYKPTIFTSSRAKEEYESIF
jgi:replicative DNA helicase